MRKSSSSQKLNKKLWFSRHLISFFVLDLFRNDKVCNSLTGFDCICSCASLLKLMIDRKTHAHIFKYILKRIFFVYVFNESIYFIGVCVLLTFYGLSLVERNLLKEKIGCRLILNRIPSKTSNKKNMKESEIDNGNGTSEKLPLSSIDVSPTPHLPDNKAGVTEKMDNNANDNRNDNNNATNPQRVKVSTETPQAQTKGAKKAKNLGSIVFAAIKIEPNKKKLFQKKNKIKKCPCCNPWFYDNILCMRFGICPDRMYGTACSCCFWSSNERRLCAYGIMYSKVYIFVYVLIIALTIALVVEEFVTKKAFSKSKSDPTTIKALD
ncbi:hypothetical protein RFI_26976, partial [Reticulomyxa filosa]